MAVATDKARVVAYVDPKVKESLERMAEDQNRTLSNLIETLLVEAVRESGESPSGGK